MKLTSLGKITLSITIGAAVVTGCTAQHPQDASPLPPSLHTEAEQTNPQPKSAAPNRADLLQKSLTQQAKAKETPAPVTTPAPSPEQPLPSAQPAAPSPKPERQANKKPIERREGKPTSTESTKRTSSKALTLSQLVKKYPNLLLLKGSSQKKQIALTFDDAPDTKYTLQVLDILKQHNVKATFFVVGRMAERHPNVIKRMSREGHVVGNHTYNHSLLTKLSDSQFQSQITKTQKIIQNQVGYTPKLIRPPYGEISESQLLWASRNHYVIVNWNVDSKDWRQLSQDQVTSNVLDHAGSGSIILQHSGGGPNQNLSGSVSALPVIIKTLRDRGYELVTLPELLKVSERL
ncbi:polysaccharide deacetylase family protein [Paenibacillus sp. H1-7]|uniref:polysaccharide deacetylase family protein n=1 Tax=Paenibacillus sp. H1-7 TaxID=2282849 RepID=UPI001EF851DA|nr:polysaccharide deacetylase family protein [Paenibacillus sp. H1-7]ULL18707.1 polysaccharide deacetylase family protein [Paenibacillus sp. H1-7]